MRHVYSFFVAIFATLSILTVLDALAAGKLPSLRSNFPGILIGLTAFGTALTLTGSSRSAAAIVCALGAILVIVSRLKQRVLGEHLVFSDLALATSFLRYPRFYMEAIPLAARIALALLLIVGAALIVEGVTAALLPRLEGAVTVLAAVALFALVWRLSWHRTLMPSPSLESDVRRFGLFSTLAVYTLRWRHETDPPPLPPLRDDEVDGFDVVCIVQCESFMDPNDLPGSRPSLPVYERLTRTALRRGHLRLGHFGAYTMRSEYGVLFGRNEGDLGFRRYDPYLTAQGETSLCLAARLKDLFTRRIFLHPHDLRFYERDRLIPAAGFTTLIGPEAFDENALCGTYVGDDALAREIVRLAGESAAQSLFLYAVTIENHGPWSANAEGASSPLDGYKSHMENADKMLKTLDLAFRASGKRTLFAFFGDHQPSLPGAVTPKAPRRTPYFIARYGTAPATQPTPPTDLTPAQLHDAILHLIAPGPAKTQGREHTDETAP